jgi:hypothetical protein
VAEYLGAVAPGVLERVGEDRHQGEVAGVDHVDLTATMIDTHVLGSGRVPVRSPLDQLPTGCAPAIGGEPLPAIAERSPPPRRLQLPAATPDANDEPDEPGPR